MGVIAIARLNAGIAVLANAIVRAVGRAYRVMEHAV